MENLNQRLIKMATKVAKFRKISSYVSAGQVGCALITDKNNIYVGVCVESVCGLGFCAEHTAIASMLTQGEYRIKKIVAVGTDGRPLPPCGRCRELMYRVTKQDGSLRVIIGTNKEVRLKELLPDPWKIH